MTEIVLAIVMGPLLWLAGAIVFDGVHWVLHLMLRSRFAILRTLARPHGVHHEWIDRQLVTNWDMQSANIWCHIVPEFLTQLVFTGVVALILPPPFAVVLLSLQALVFLFILRDKGRDINHRPTPRIDAHPPGWTTPPSYHLLHHVWPDAYFSAYTKAVDWLVGGGAQIGERRFGWRGADSALRAALGDALREEGASVRFDTADLDALDVLVLADADAPLAGAVEPFIRATRDRQLAPEVWAVRASDGDPVARHYLKDPRVVFRTLLAPEAGLAGLSPAEARAAARRVLVRIRRDARFVPLGDSPGGSALRRFLRTEPVAPEGAQLVRHRMEYLAGG